MADPARHLQVVDAETGEIVEHEDCPGCAQRDEEIAGLETEKRSWRSRYYNLKRDKDREAREHNLFPAATRLFNHWREVCGHPKAEFTPDRFWMVEPYLRRRGPDICERAINGAGFDAFETTRKNGSTKRHNGWDLIFQSSDKLDEFAARAPHPAPWLDVELEPHELTRSLYAADGATPLHGPLPADWTKG